MLSADIDYLTREIATSNLPARAKRLLCESLEREARPRNAAMAALAAGLKDLAVHLPPTRAVLDPEGD